VCALYVYCKCICVKHLQLTYTCKNCILNLAQCNNYSHLQISYKGHLKESYEEWLTLWNDHVVDTPNPSILLSTAQHITIPLQVQNWYHHLQAHPNQEFVQYFITGPIFGFRVGLTSQSPLHSAKKNMSSALAHPSVEDDYLQTKLDQKRIAGPFLTIPIPGSSH